MILLSWAVLERDFHNWQTCCDCDEQVIPGQDNRAIEALCWVNQRLFSAGLNGEVTEYDLEKLKPKYTVVAYGGPTWTISCNNQGTMLAVSKDDVHIASQCLFTQKVKASPDRVCSWSDCFLCQVGCEDGTVKMFEVLEESIQFQRNLDRQKGNRQPAGSVVLHISLHVHAVTYSNHVHCTFFFFFFLIQLCVLQHIYYLSLCDQWLICDLLGRIISLSWHPSGTLIAAGMMDMIRVFDAETGKKLQLLSWSDMYMLNLNSVYSLNVPHANTVTPQFLLLFFWLQAAPHIDYWWKGVQGHPGARTLWFGPLPSSLTTPSLVVILQGRSRSGTDSQELWSELTW